MRPVTVGGWPLGLHARPRAACAREKRRRGTGGPGARLSASTALTARQAHRRTGHGLWDGRARECTDAQTRRRHTASPQTQDAQAHGLWAAGCGLRAAGCTGSQSDGLTDAQSSPVAYLFCARFKCPCSRRIVIAGRLVCSIEWQLAQTGRRSLIGSSWYPGPRRLRSRM